MRRSLRKLLPVTMLLLSACARDGVERVDVTELERRLELSTRSAPGVVFGAIWRDGARVVRAVGYADLSQGRLARETTSFAWFSTTKLYTATAVLQLAERGLVELEAPVGRYLPGVLLRKRHREATVRDLLAHTSGLANPLPITWIHAASEHGPSLDAMIRERIGTHPQLDSIPGTKSAYSNLGYLLLGQIVEKVSEQPFERYVEQHVLAPLGSEASVFKPTSDSAMGYQRKFSIMGVASRWILDSRYFQESVDGYWQLTPFVVDGAPYGGLHGPVTDLLRLGQMMLADGEGTNGRVLTPESVRAMIRPTRIAKDRITNIGLGWHIGETGGEAYAHHLGGGGGYRSELRIYPRLGYAVAVVANETSFDTNGLASIIVR